MSEAAPGCRLTLHVLDVAAGRPAAGVAVALVGLIDGVEVDLGATATDDDGRSSGPGPGWTALGTGPHELRFDVGAHFRAQAPGLGSFYEIVPVRFVIGATDAHVHLALLASPWSYTTYRGS